jgi:hypothetical protein
MEGTQNQATETTTPVTGSAVAEPKTDTTPETTPTPATEDKK